MNRPDSNETVNLHATAAVRRRILCASDLTPRSERAVRRAALLSAQMQADVVFVTVVNDRRPSRVARMKVARARLQLMQQVDRVMPQQATSVEVHVGHPLATIARAAKEYSADLLVLAAPSPRRYEQFMGTTAERIIRSAGCPVLFVNSEASAEYCRAVLATDLSRVSARVAQAVSRLGLLRGAFSWFIHAFDPPLRRLAAESATTDVELATYKRQHSALVRAQLGPQLDAAGFDLRRVRIHTDIAQPMHAIDETIRRVQPELLVIGTTRWFMLKRMLQSSVAHEVLSRVRCDILAVPSTATRGDAVRVTPTRGANAPARSRRAAHASPPSMNI
jgi:nucleotide-binding universal stress UspA family protein